MTVINLTVNKTVLLIKNVEYKHNENIHNFSTRERRNIHINQQFYRSSKIVIFSFGITVWKKLPGRARVPH